MLVGRQLVVIGRHDRDDFVVLANDIGNALDKGVIDLDAAHILGARFCRGRQLLGAGDRQAFIGGDGEFAGAEIRIR